MSTLRTFAAGAALAAAAGVLAVPVAAAAPGPTFDPSPPRLPALIVSNATFNSAGPGAVNVYMEAKVFRGNAPYCEATFTPGGGGISFGLYNTGAQYSRSEYYNQFSGPGHYTALVTCSNSQGQDSRTFAFDVR